MATSIIGTGHDLPANLATDGDLARRCVDVTWALSPAAHRRDGVDALDAELDLREPAVAAATAGSDPCPS